VPSEPADEVPEAKTDARRRSLRAAVAAIENYLARRTGKQGETGTSGSAEPLNQ
jgi:hypothetical protein